MRNNQNKRMRGRNNRGHNNNRGNHHNPLTRVYESNGPDVKIRGTAHHVAEKYLQLARDASSSGDPVTAENHYQHAEHYLRLIAAAQEQFRQQNPYYQAPPAPGENVNDGPFDDGDEDGQQPQQGQQGQPNFGNQPAQQNQQPYAPREHQQPNYGQQQHRPQPQHQQPQPNYQPQYQQPQPTFEGNNGLPSFITGGQPQQNAQGETMNGRDGNPHDGNGREHNGPQNGDRFPRRRRRHPRGPRPEMAGAPHGDQPPGE